MNTATTKRTKRSNIEELAVFTVSIAHLTREEVLAAEAAAESVSELVAATDPYGVWVEAWTGNIATAKFNHWHNMAAVLQWARDVGADWVRFDRDAIVLAHLPTFDW